MTEKEDENTGEELFLLRATLAQGVHIKIALAAAQCRRDVLDLLERTTDPAVKARLEQLLAELWEVT